MRQICAAISPADAAAMLAFRSGWLTKTIDDHLARVNADRTPPASVPDHPQLPPEQDGPKGPEPTRFGDWEQKGRCTDF